MGMDITRMAETALPCGVTGLIFRIDSEDVTALRELLMKTFGVKDPDMSPESMWYTAYAVIPSELAERLGWSCELGEDTPCLAGLPVHGGCTYAKLGELKEADVPEDALVIGWDYHHGQDRFADNTLEKVFAELREFGEYIRQKAEEE